MHIYLNWKANLKETEVELFGTVLDGREIQRVHFCKPSKNASSFGKNWKNESYVFPSRSERVCIHYYYYNTIFVRFLSMLFILFYFIIKCDTNRMQNAEPPNRPNVRYLLLLILLAILNLFFSTILFRRFV